MERKENEIIKGGWNKYEKGEDKYKVIEKGLIKRG